MGGHGGTSISSRERAESVLSAMRDAGMKPVKSVEETEAILNRTAKRLKTSQAKARVELAKERKAKEILDKKYSDSNDKVYNKFMESVKLANSGDMSGAEKALAESKRIAKSIPIHARRYTPKGSAKDFILK